MAGSGIMAEIIELCLSLDRRAERLYTAFSARSQREEDKDFWRGMADDERDHAEYWGRLYDLAREGCVPLLFDRPREVRTELEAACAGLDDPAGAEGDGTMRSFLTAACRCEFAMLGASYLSLFHYLKTISGEPIPADSHERHIARLTAALEDCEPRSVELSLLGRALTALWDKSRNLMVQGNIDSLTGVLSRQGILHSITSLSYLALRNNYTVGVMVIDIDDFRRINDVYGRSAGDAIIRSVSSIIKRYIRSSDVLGRYGNEEFLVFFPSVDAGYLYNIADRILKHVEEESRSAVPVTVSIGVAQGPVRRNVEESTEYLIKEADLCLENSKNTGKNKVTCTSYDSGRLQMSALRL